MGCLNHISVGPPTPQAHVSKGHQLDKENEMFNSAVIIGGALIALVAGPAFAQPTNVPENLELILDSLTTLQEAVADLQNESSEPRTIFTTSTHHNGNFGGLVGADAICQALADDPSAIVPAGEYVALLSTSDVQASGRISHSSRPYVRPDGAPVAPNSAALFGCRIGSGDCAADFSLINSPSIDEKGDLAQAFVWTGSNVGGLAGVNGQCLGWTADSGSIALTGLSISVSSDWMGRKNSTCDEEQPLYCVQR
jgi:hypothetical protein